MGKPLNLFLKYNSHYDHVKQVKCEMKDTELNLALLKKKAPKSSKSALDSFFVYAKNYCTTAIKAKILSKMECSKFNNFYLFSS